ncbi:YggS family pyridoxal phosphate-dependent enzyme [Anaerobiospirillum sp. NML120449]|uniref:YggS family pyridoxal phosphate-dependent enzyme n=1 Tax=Anaerobiospirillum sp. NML120449 TaxID=2932817 RepID=UPI001FF53ED2|nr:YggS family pyridoxal phosphate-dependent enzyme [Anaerobiospirillum sp. NML120449]MCK0526161.1 YggS family pyridoxal phosphate-dependent enzyme [Anaerobiospirillum sp. NML120449]
MQNILENLASVHALIDKAAASCGRDRSEVILLCVSKTKPLEQIKEAWEQGERHFGESYVNEAVDKIKTLKEQGVSDIVWHFIGPLQSNKTRPVAAHFDVVESVDRMKVLERLNDQRPEGMAPLKIMIQVNISHEEQKQGCEEQELPELLKSASLMPNVEVIGLMGVARIDAPEEELNASFARLRELRDQYQQLYPELKELSMGMTADMASAVANGSTEVRIGSAIFGEREYKNRAQS